MPVAFELVRGCVMIILIMCISSPSGKVPRV